MEKIRALIQKHYEFLSFVFFGGLTTVVNYLVYIPCLYLLGLSATLSNVIAWPVAVVFAFVTNKPFVFRSHDWSAKVVWPELGKFVGARLVSGGIETAIILVTVDLFHWNGIVMKLVVSVLVIVMNYLGGKLLVFRKSKKS